MQFKVDYLRFSIIPQFEINNRITFITFIISSVLGMHDKLFYFETTKCGGFYDFKFYYHNIYIKAPPEDKPGEGYQVELTGEGYDYYMEYKKSFDPGFSDRKLFSNLLTLRENNLFKVNFTRLDIAIDDKSYSNDFLLDFNIIRQCVLDGAVLTRFRHRTAVSDGVIHFSPDKETPYIIYEKGSSRNKIKGSTIYLGSRSHTHVRFYDKIAEMTAHGKEFDPNLKHWLRFELQACHDNALALIVNIVKLQPDEFNKYLSKVLFNMVRFVDISKENISSNYFRCPVLKWWSEFLGVVEKSKLIHRKPKVNKYNKAVRFIKHNMSSSFYALVRCMGYQNVIGIIKEGAEEHYDNRRHGLIVDDYLHYGNYEFDELSGVDAYKVYFNNDDEFRQFLIEMRKLREATLLVEMDMAKSEQGKNYGYC